MAPLLAGLLLLPQLWLFARVVQMSVVEGSAVSAQLHPLVEIAALMAVRAALVGWGEIQGSRAAAGVTLALRNALFRHLLRQRPDWTSARSSGELSGAIVDQVGALDAYLARYIPAMATAAALPVGFALTAFVVDPVAGLLFLVSAPLIPVFMALVGWGAEAASARHQTAFLRLSGFFADRLRGLVTLKLLGRAEAETRHLSRAGEDLRARTFDVLRIAFLSSAVLEFFAALGVAGIALYVGLSFLGFVQIRAVPLTVQAGLFCLMLAPEVYLPLRLFAAHYHDRAAAKAAMAGLIDLFETLPPLAADAAPMPVAPALIERSGASSVFVSSLGVRTPDTARPVLVDAEFAAFAGEHIALLGASGSGKSTLIEAMAGLRAFEGTIEIGGRRLADMPDEVLRSRVAVLGQRPRLFQASIGENIGFARAQARPDEILRAAERAGVMRFVDALSNGLRTPIGEGGLGLSGGEAHRVALARIFLCDPGLILLDEPTAHLDRDTEQAVLDGILDFARGRTLIVATHSGAVAERMDRVLRIEANRVFATPYKLKALSSQSRRGVA